MGGKYSMQPTWKTKGCIFCIILCLLIGSSSIVVAQEEEDLPDLIITAIHINRFAPLLPNIGCWVENIGTAPTSDFTVKTTVRRLFLGLIPMEKNYTIVHQSYPGYVLIPGDDTSVIILERGEMPTPGGFWRLSCTVNHDGSIEELNYDNNQNNKTVFHMGGFYPHIINKFINS
jgi:hypothetical protein